MKILKFVLSMELSLCITSLVVAQNQIIVVEQVTPTILTDGEVSQKLQRDWSKRNAATKNQLVKWYVSGDYFYGTYTNNNHPYMALYDTEGNYIETLKKSEWNSKVPNPVRSSFDLSDYKKQEVIAFWIVSDPGKMGYYLELIDDLGKESRIWANEKGDFSVIPPLTVKSIN